MSTGHCSDFHRVQCVAFSYYGMPFLDIQMQHDNGELFMNDTQMSNCCVVNVNMCDTNKYHRHQRELRYILHKVIRYVQARYTSDYLMLAVSSYVKKTGRIPTICICPNISFLILRASGFSYLHCNRLYDLLIVTWYVDVIYQNHSLLVVSKLQFQVSISINDERPVY